MYHFSYKEKIKTLETEINNLKTIIKFLIGFIIGLLLLIWIYNDRQELKERSGFVGNNKSHPQYVHYIIPVDSLNSNFLGGGNIPYFINSNLERLKCKNCGN